MERKSPPFHFLIVKAELAYTIITATAKIARQQPMTQYGRGILFLPQSGGANAIARK